MNQFIYWVLLLMSAQAISFPPLFRVSPPDGGICSYVLGTMHALPISQFPVEALSLAQESRSVSLELHPRPPTPRERIITITPNSAHVLTPTFLSENMSRRSFRILQSRMNRHLLNDEWIRLHPFMLILLFELLPQLEIETFEEGLASHCTAQQIVGLETRADLQRAFEKILHSLPQRPEAYLRDLKEIVRFSIEASFTPHIRDHLNGEIAEPNLSSEESQIVARILWGERNLSWMPRIRSEINQGNSFIGVGSLHLFNENGILTLLESEGHRIEPIRSAQELSSRASP